ncbi:MAG: prolyl oligopeptidase family serine peptidase [Fimbriimonadaceae bacterium]|nr:prolyl oligopeptidase family serine peptidase [Fimbriimonadaceae bacterium]
MILPINIVAEPDFGLKVEAVYARQIPARARSLVRVDPIEAEVITGKLRAEKPWESRAITGWKVAPAGYVWVRINSPKDQILQLNVSGASMAYVNGEPRVGDVYGYGTYFIPVDMKQGVNEVLLTGFRGDATLNWRKVEAEIELDRFDATLPDFRVDANAAQGSWGGFVVRNNSTRPRIVSLHSEGARQTLPAEKRMIPPLGMVKVPIAIPNSSVFSVILQEGNSTWAHKVFKLQSRKAGEPFRRTFRSAMDGSAQYYAVNPSSRPNPKVAVLSLHGASVEAIGQAQAYGQKDFCDIICPTNRRPFGFNWEGIGRKDALEVLSDARWLANYDPDRIMLTGHSMGGHGTWHLGANYPNIFAAIAPCAGWISFDTYAGGANYDLDDPVQKLLARGNQTSDTLLLKANFSQYQSVYIHHGGADETVPITEARKMRDELTPVAKVTYSEVPGMGHWFDNDPAPGADSVDWKPFFDIFRTARKSDPVRLGKVRFRTYDVDVNADFGLGQVLAQQHPLERSTISADLHGDTWRMTTANVFRIRTGHAGLINLDGQAFIVKKGDVFTKVGPRWRKQGPNEMSFHGATSAYAHNVQWAGPWQSPIATKAGLWAMARFHLEQLWYRANATPELVELDRARINDRNYWEYLYADANQDRATFRTMPTSRRERMKTVITGYSLFGLKFAERFPLLSPGIAYPDWFATDIGMLQGEAKHTQAGYTDPSGNEFESLASSAHFPK